MAIWPFLSRYNKRLDSSFPEDGNMAVSITVLQAVKLDSSFPEDGNMAISIMVSQAIKLDCSFPENCNTAVSIMVLQAIKLDCSFLRMAIWPFLSQYYKRFNLIVPFLR